MFFRSPTPFCSLPSAWLARPFACSLRLPVSEPSFARALPAKSFMWPLAWSLFMSAPFSGRKRPLGPEQGACLCRRLRRPFRLAGHLRRLRVDIGPGRRALRPDVPGDAQGGRVVQRPGAHAEHFRHGLAMAEERGAAIAAEIAHQRAAAVGLLRIALGRAAYQPEVLRAHECHHRAVCARSALAVAAM